MNAPSARRLPLEGVRVLCQGIVWAGPFASLILADLGAEVIEVESIQHLNPTRTTMRHIPELLMQGSQGTQYVGRDGSEGFWNRQNWFNYSKRGCKSITLDLNRERGRELFYDLVRVSDAFIENNAASVVERLQIDWPQLSAINPRLIMVRFPGFGISGPYREFKGFGTIMEGVIGHTMLRGYEDADPGMTGDSLHGDPNAGAHVAFALQAALWARRRTGKGQLIDLSQAEALGHHIAYAFMDYSMNRRVQGHWGNRHPSMAPYGVFACAGEDRWVAIAVPSDAAFARLCDVMGQPDLAQDARFADIVARYANRDEANRIVGEWTAHGEPRDLMRRLQAAGVPAAALSWQEEMLGDPQLVARKFFERITAPEAGTHSYPGPMAKLERTPLTPVRGPAPCLGEHSEEVLRGTLGLSAHAYQQLLDEQIIGTTYLESAT